MLLRPADVIAALGEYWTHMPRAFAPLVRLGADLPAVASAVGFELRLHGPDELVDLGLQIAGRSAFRALSSGAAGPAAASPAWAAVARLASHRQQPSEAGAARVPFAHLEFDAAEGNAGRADPSIFAALEWTHEELAGPAAGARCVERVSALFAEMLGAPPDDAREATLRRCGRALPEGAVLLHAGAMLARPTRDLRLSIALPRLRAGRFLHDCGWEDGLTEIDLLLDALAPATEFHAPTAPVQLDVDLGDGAIMSRVGIALRPRRAGNWESLLGHFAATGLCHDRCADAVLAWPGISPGAASAQHPHLLVRAISHLKLACGADRPPIMKAYVGAAPLAAGDQRGRTPDGFAAPGAK